MILSRSLHLTRHMQLDRSNNGICTVNLANEQPNIVPPMTLFSVLGPNHMQTAQTTNTRHIGCQEYYKAYADNNHNHRDAAACSEQTLLQPFREHIGHDGGWCGNSNGDCHRVTCVTSKLISNVHSYPLPPNKLSSLSLRLSLFTCAGY